MRRLVRQTDHDLLQVPGLLSVGGNIRGVEGYNLMVSQRRAGFTFNQALGQSLDAGALADAAGADQGYGASMVVKSRFDSQDAIRVGQPAEMGAVLGNAKADIMAETVEQRRVAEGPIAADAAVIMFSTMS